MARFLVTAMACAAVLVVSSQAVVLEASADTITFVSDLTWEVSDPAENVLGLAQNVCLNASWPQNCPPGATIYGFPNPGWGADLSSIPGATWIWAPGITGATSPAFPAEYFFSKTFDLPGPPTAGTISVAADDVAEVRINDIIVGTANSQGALATFDILPFLLSGTNVITIRANNGNFGCGSGPYSCNTAGTVFGGSLQFLAAVPMAPITWSGVKAQYR